MEETSARRVRGATLVAFGLLGVGTTIGWLLGAQGQTPSETTASGAERLGASLGIASVAGMALTFFLGWPATGRWLVGSWGPLRRYRVDVHNWISVGVLSLALWHSFQFTAMNDLRGWISGWLTNFLLLGLFATGWWRAEFVDGLGLRRWRLLHWEFALGALAFSLLHWLLIAAGAET